MSANTSASGVCHVGQVDLASDHYLSEPSRSMDEWRRLVHLGEPRDEGAHLVHLVRDPISTTVSFYLFHRAGWERNSTYFPLVRSLRQLPMSEGVHRAAGWLLRFELPAMASIYRLLRGREGRDVTTLRLEEFTASSASFDRAAARLLEAAGVAPAAVSGLLVELGHHDTRRNGTSTMRGHVHIDGAKPWTNATEVRLALERGPAKPIAEELRVYGRALGYRYPGDGAAGATDTR